MELTTIFHVYIYIYIYMRIDETAIMKGECVGTQDSQHEPNHTARDFLA